MNLAVALGTDVAHTDIQSLIEIHCEDFERHPVRTFAAA